LVHEKKTDPQELRAGECFRFFIFIYFCCAWQFHITPAKRVNKTDPGNPNGMQNCFHADYMHSYNIDPKNLQLSHFPDPLNCYGQVIPKDLQQSIKVIVPPIQHADGTLVNPLHYGTVLSESKMVAVDVMLRVYVGSLNKQ
jgi:hypothetical protein